MPTISLPDIELHYRAQGPADADHTLLFVHGSLGSGRWWQPALSFIPPAWRAIMLDQRGSGQSRRPGADDDEAFYAIPRLAADLAQAVEALGLFDYHLIAHAFGGAVALEGIVRRWLQPQSLILVDTAPGMGVVTPPEAFLVFERMRLERSLLAQALASLMPRRPPDAFFHSLVDDVAALPPAAFTGPARALAGWNVMDALPNVQLPTLLIRGDLDTMVDAESVRATFLAIRGAANLEVFRGCGHCPMIEQPAAFVDSIVRFLAEDEFLTHADLDRQWD